MSEILPFIATMFVLSLVCERVGEFLKNYLSEFRIGNFQVTGDTVTKAPPDSEEEQIRHYRILKINLLVGFVTALLCHANLFAILKNIKDPSTVLVWPDLTQYGWDSKYIVSNIRFVIGCFFTGAFISLGSKFWHDLLDLLLKVKDAKRDVEGQTIKPLSDLPKEEQKPLLNAAIAENINTWRNTYKNYQGVQIANKQVTENNQEVETDQLSLQFMVSKKENFTTVAPNRIPKCIYYKGVRIPTDVIPSGKKTAIADKIDPKVLPRPLGSSIGRIKTEYSGTLGALVYEGEAANRTYFGLSCYHVLFPEELKNEIYEVTQTQQIKDRVITSPSIEDESEGNPIGTVRRGVFNEFIDIGFFETSRDRVSDHVFKFGVPDSIYHVEDTDERNLSVKFCGRTSGIVTEGRLELVSSYPLINYFNKFNHQFMAILSIKIKAKEGDSGAAVLTHDNKLIGILVGVDDDFAYAIPVSYIESNFPYKFDTK